MITIIIVIVIIISIAIILSNNRSTEKTIVVNTTFSYEDTNSLRKKEIRDEMINMGVQSITSIEMSSEEKFDLHFQVEQFFFQNYSNDFEVYFKEIAHKSYLYEIENFTLCKDLSLRIKERYELFLENNKGSKNEDFDYTELMIFSNYYRDNYNPNSPEYKANEICKSYIEIGSNCLTSLEFTESEKDKLFSELTENIVEYFPDKYDQTFDKIADESYKIQIENYQNNFELYSALVERYKTYQKATRPLKFDDYGFEDIKHFCEKYKESI